MVVVPLLAVALGACAATPVAAPASVPTSSAPTLAPAAATAIPTVVASTETMVFCGTFGKYEGAGAPSTSLWELLSPTGISNVRFRWAVSPQDRPDLGAYICVRVGPSAGQDAAFGVNSAFVSLVNPGEPGYVPQP